MTKLYEVSEGLTEKTFANKLAVNSNGQWVMEEKGTGRVFTANKNEVEEVFPHTVDVQNLGNTAVCSYTYPKGKLAVGDLVLTPNSQAKRGSSVMYHLVVVKGVDTKQTNATKELQVLGKVALDKSVV